MKYILLVVILVASASHSLAYELNWGTGGGNTNLLVLNGTVTTPETFTTNYELRLMYIGKVPSLSSRGYAIFLLTDTGTHLPPAGKIQHTAIIPGGNELSERKLLPVLYEKATGKHFYLSISIGGAAVTPHTVPTIWEDASQDFPGDYYPTSPTGWFYKGSEVPPFCGWLSNYGLTESNLVSVSTNKVNLAFAVNANPTNFNDVAVSITNFVIGASVMNGKFSFISYNAQNTPSSVTKLNGATVLSLVASPTLSGSMNAITGSSVNLTNKTFQVTHGATNTTEFFRVKLNVPAVW